MLLTFLKSRGCIFLSAVGYMAGSLYFLLHDPLLATGSRNRSARRHSRGTDAAVTDEGSSYEDPPMTIWDSYD